MLLQVKREKWGNFLLDEKRAILWYDQEKELN